MNKLELYIEKARNVHGNRYDYSLIDEYKGVNAKYPIICPIHGVFYKTLTKHISGKQGCPCCSGKERYTTETFIKKVETFDHTNLYTYENLVYLNNKTKVKVFCHNVDENGNEHGEFEITPGHLLSGEGCPKCRYIKSSDKNRRTLEDVINECKKVHGDRYDYSLITEYKNDRIKYDIICPEHGVFQQTMNNHIKGKQGCPECGRMHAINERTLTRDEFVERAIKIHGDLYDYSKVNYVNNREKVEIICKKHGSFFMKPSNHIDLSQGCPKCNFAHSKQETEVYEYLCGLIGVENVIQRDRSVLDDGTEIDIYIPSKKLAIEYNGLFWHSEVKKDKNYHLNKTNICNSKGIRLFHIFEDEWLYKKEIIKSMLKNLLSLNIDKIYARKCVIKEVSSKDSRDFLNDNHLQGYCNSTYRYGLYFENELVSLMTFGNCRHFVGNNKNNNYELLRFCNKKNINVIGGASKLLNYFIKNHDNKDIISYADKRWSNGGIYEKLGFVKYDESKPNYYYIINGKRVYRYNLRKQILIKKYGCSNDMTEKEFCYKNGWYRIYDCGCLCYKYSGKKIRSL